MVVVRDVTDASMVYDAGGRQEPVRAVLSWVVGTAWWATGPIRSGGRVALRAADAVVTEITRRGWPLLTNPPAAGAATKGPIEPLIRALLRPLVVRVVDVALTELDVTQLVLQYVDLDAVAAKLDVQAVVERVDVEAVVDRVDLDRVVSRVDLDAAVARVALDRIIDRIDIDGIVAGVNLQAVIDRIDVDAIVDKVDVGAVVNRVDLDAIAAKLDVEAVIDRVDLDRVVSRVDLDAAVARVALDRIIDRIDIDGIVAGVDLQAVIDRIDIAAIVALVDPDPVVARVNFDAALAKVDMIGIAQQVVDGVDLPGIIRDSTGSLASEAVHGVRVQGQHADDAVGQLVGRVFRRRASTIDGYPSE